MTIVEFIEARIAEDEAAALAARPGPWIDDRDSGPRVGPKLGDGWLMVPESELAPCEDYIPIEDTTHIARHDPARVLRQCEALRAMLEYSHDATGYELSVENDRGVGSIDRSTDPYIGDLMQRSIAAIWSDHSDYQQDWSIA